ncbi:hypothetical protein GCM10009530_56750 [Microbispora corallina]|uniref:Immunity protein 63 domain-containing protein n=1 Tax=Microbispora corallina TaxID=83302 RepID=A0ABQ4G954_9ACTN|nr:hypothetical protein [Microbispora corallina]GIH43503.1 hypothetical protein Mco01_65030 [Microbispora corallina]
MKPMRPIQEKQRAYQEQLLTELREALESRAITAVSIVDASDRPGVDVTDSRFRPRRIYVHLAFLWFYWGDQPDERVSCLRIDHATDTIEKAARDGWHEGPQGELHVDLSKVLDAHRM